MDYFVKIMLVDVPKNEMLKWFIEEQYYINIKASSNVKSKPCSFYISVIDDVF